MLTIKKDCCPCECTPRVIASYTTNRNNPTWNLSAYQGNGVGDRCGKWRVYETSGRITYSSGDIDHLGRLVGLPSSFTSNYYYDGYMQLQQGCCPPNNPCDCDSWYVNWP